MAKANRPEEREHQNERHDPAEQAKPLGLAPGAGAPAPDIAAADTAAGDASDQAAEPKRARQPASLVVTCPYHKCKCKSNRSDPFFTRYYCPEKGCTYSQKVPRPQMIERVEAAEDQDRFSAR